MNAYSTFPADRASLSRVADRLEGTIFAHRRYGSAIHGPDTEMDGATERALVDDFATIEAFWRDPAPFDAAKREGQAAINDLLDGHALKHMQAIWDKE